ncbi:hypothetical protein [Pseudoalteromonas sp. Angola-18]|jgi:hypothetical protein|uniref:hypothetical protein n=1 Tax=Pseudoalteromonas sp. Angola-18 TaxID=3025338 RepID=UPI002358DAC1|nr:hypothetical protein [Pseudoalteromonas sp. Angola-18]MCP4056507.1 hypothetical protein [Pseudoalteromonas sp.]MDC9502881.1 hypothetical protein [Pseudoalteromonas sp. Angola-18]|tara:strand:+ start:3858 stop:4190 length:333 start_codon:yes stop_codon:yes gene_type:complete
MSRIENAMTMMAFLDASGVDRNGQAMQEATVQLMDKSGRNGLVSVSVFTGQHSSFGPHLLFGDEIRSFGIPYTEFKTNYEFPSFELNEGELELSIKGTNYEFSIKNLRLD